MDLRAVTLIAVCVAVTIVLRFLPFVIFGRKKEIPGYITYLSGVLPYAIMGMLVVYCLKNVSFFAGSHGIPEIAGFRSAVVGLHVWKRNTLLSIAAGTVLYMFLIQAVF
ncbi:MAG: branched-chain amino acid transporter permease [Pilosibacter sp.]